MEGSLLQEDVTQKVPELVVHERTSQGEKSKGWSIEEIKDKPNSLLEEDTAEMRKWRGMNQKDMDQCWKELAGESEEEVLNKYKVEDSKREAYREALRAKKAKKIQDSKVERRLPGKNLRLVWRVKFAASAKYA